MKDRINLTIKYHEEFRPFCPSARHGNIALANNDKDCPGGLGRAQRALEIGDGLLQAVIQRNFGLPVELGLGLGKVRLTLPWIVLRHVDRAVDAGLGRLHGIALVMDRGSRTGEVEDRVDLDMERKRHVVAHRLEQRLGQQMGDVAPAAGKIVVDANYLSAFGQQPLAQMGADESRAARTLNNATSARKRLWKPQNSFPRGNIWVRYGQRRERRPIADI